MEFSTVDKPSGLHIILVGSATYPVSFIRYKFGIFVSVAIDSLETYENIYCLKSVALVSCDLHDMYIK